MVRAAAELFEQRGFDQTTTADIAERAGVTERTFFRHFPDKREVLFDGTHRLQDMIDEAIASAPADVSPLEAALLGMTATAGTFNEIREHALRRAAIVAATPSLQERELLKLASMTQATATALHNRGTGEPTATLAAHSAVTVFHVAFSHWIQADAAPDFADCIAEAAAALRTLT
jgi:AcrR family transcriptional regulator